MQSVVLLTSRSWNWSKQTWTDWTLDWIQKPIVRRGWRPVANLGWLENKLKIKLKLQTTETLIIQLKVNNCVWGLLRQGRIVPRWLVAKVHLYTLAPTTKKWTNMVIVVVVQDTFLYNFLYLTIIDAQSRKHG